MQVPASQPAQAKNWEPLGEPTAPVPAPTSSPSDDLLQLNAAFSVQQSSSTAFSQSPAFPPSQSFPAAQGFGQSPAVSNGFGGAPQAGPWGGSAATPGKIQCFSIKHLLENWIDGQ